MSSSTAAIRTRMSTSGRPATPRLNVFLVRGDRADFGWVFWEKFTDRRLRKLFGSVVRNEKRDWEIQLGAGSREPIYARLAGRMKMDPDRPSTLG